MQVIWQESYDKAVSQVKYQDAVYILQKFKHKCNIGNYSNTTNS